MKAVPSWTSLKMHALPRVAWAPYVVGCALVGLFAGCGDVRGETSGVQLALDLRGAQWAAYRDGHGLWRPLTLVAPTQLVTLPLAGDVGLPGVPEVGASRAAGEYEGGQKVTITDPEGLYGVASVCADSSSGSVLVSVQHATLADGAQLFAGCAAAPTSTEMLTVSGQVAGLERGAYSSVYLGAREVLVDSAAPQHLLELPVPSSVDGQVGRAAPRFDLVAARYGGGALVPERLVLEPNLELRHDQRVDIDFLSPSSFTPERGTLELKGISPDEVASATVYLLTPNGTQARLGELSSGDTLAYAKVPPARLAGSMLQLSAQSFSYSDRSKAGSSRSVKRTFNPPLGTAADPGAELSLSLPEAFGPVELTLQGASGALRPRASWRALEAGIDGSAGGATANADGYAQFYSQIRNGRTLSYALSQSDRWAQFYSAKEHAALKKGVPPTLSYALPDFSRLDGWKPEWGLTREADIFWDVSFSRVRRYEDETTETVFANRSGVLEP